MQNILSEKSIINDIIYIIWPFLSAEVGIYCELSLILDVFPHRFGRRFSD